MARCRVRQISSLLKYSRSGVAGASGTALCALLGHASQGVTADATQWSLPHRPSSSAPASSKRFHGKLTNDAFSERRQRRRHDFSFSR
jgi:hypothetical protein